MDKKNIWIVDNPIKIIVGVGLIIRLFIAFLYQYIDVYPDSFDYRYLAQRLSVFDLNGYVGVRSPGYPLLIMLAGNKLDIVVLLQFIIGIVTNVFTYKLLLVINWSRCRALIVTLCFSVYLSIVFFEFCILTETLTLFCLILLFYFLFNILYSKQNGYVYYLAVAAACSFLVVIKPFYIFLPYLIFVLLLFYRFQIGSIICKYALVILFPTVLLLGWCQINYLNTGRFTSTTYDGFTIAQNCVSFAENTSPEYEQIGKIYAKYRKKNEAQGRDTSMSIWEASNDLFDETNLSFNDLSKLLYDYTIVTIKQNRLGYLKQVGISWTNFWKTSMYWQYDKFKIKETSLILKPIFYGERLLVQLLKIIFVFLIPYNLICFIRNRYTITPQFVISVVVLFASILQAFATYANNSRFSFPFETLIVISVIMNLINLKDRFHKYSKIGLKIFESRN